MWLLLGLLLGVGAIVAANQLEGGSLLQLVNLPAALIVFGGTLGAVMVQTPPAILRRTGQLLSLSQRTPLSHDQGIQQLIHWCITAHRKGLVALEQEASSVEDRFVRNGLQLLADGKPVEAVRATLEVELITREQRDYQAARVLESMGGYAPTMGIIGAVLGLIQVMVRLDQPSQLGSGIATAFVATIYGIGVANLLLLPLAAKLRQMIDSRSLYHEMMMEGLLMIADGQGPKSVQLKLQGYLDTSDAAPTPS
ncbi:flagellar motor protein [Marinobacterium stanieri]|uniref:Chemotaxis protein MotA n=1 Tax=Marinobacterium stanieri TaxID=49186 RepID=A0A1N6WWZ3_9GAMM|nr:flagellar motor protein [Marinobacterium stanieri]SIQ94607.1 chemotaxis protein MotA [Marinobacterium stanieri]